MLGRGWRIALPPLILFGVALGMLYWAETAGAWSIAHLARFLFPALAATAAGQLAVELLLLFGMILFFTLIGSRRLEQTIDRLARAEEENRRLALAVEASADAILIADADGRVVYVNPAFTVQSGTTRTEAEGRYPEQLNGSRVPAYLYQEIADTLQQGNHWRGRLEHCRRSTPLDPTTETTYPVQATFAPIRDGTRLLGYVSVMREVSDLVERERRLEEEREAAEMRAAVSRLLQRPLPLVERLKSVLSYLLSPHSLGFTARRGGIFVRPENAPYLERLLLQGDFPPAFLAREEMVPLGVCRCGQAVLHPGVILDELVQPDNPDYRHYAELPPHGRIIVPLFHGEEALGVLFLYTDPYPSDGMLLQITLRIIGEMIGLAIADDRLRQTLHRTQEAVIQAEKMRSLGQLVAGVAHEINTPVGIGVTAASHFTEITRRLLTAFQQQTMKRSELEKYLADATQAGELIQNHLLRVGDLVRSFKMVSADQASQERRRFPLKGYLEDILLNLRPRLKKTTHEVKVICPEELDMDSFPGALAQVVTNLVFNSLTHAYDPSASGRLILHARQVESRVELTYADDGKGIPKEHLGRIFEPFFTTRRGQGGTGLGLHIVYNLVTQALGGQITCESTPDQGTTFTLLLPMQAPQEPPPSSP